MRTRNLFRALTVGTAAVLGGLLFAGPALAADGTIYINPNQVKNGGTTAAAFEDKKDNDCDVFDDAPLNITSAEDGWHFVISSAGDEFTSITLTFKKPDASIVPVTINTTAPTVTTGSGWRGFLKENGSGLAIHAYVITEAGWTLTAGQAEATVINTDHYFELSHVCVGTPPPPPTTTTTTTTSTETRTPPGTDSTPPTTTTEPGLPVTGASLTGMIVLALALIGGGVTLVVMRRRRDAMEPPPAA